MVFNGLFVRDFVIIIVLFWLLAVSIILLRMVYHYNRMTHGVTKATLKEILDTLLLRQISLEKQTKILEQSIQTIEKSGKYHIQRVGIVRYNPFSDTGGTQSFSLALLDEVDNGIIITSLYARTGNRWYVKEIRNGKGDHVELSKEEFATIKKAQITEIKT